MSSSMPSTVAAFEVIHTPAPVPHTHSVNKFNKLKFFWVNFGGLRPPFVFGTLGGGADMVSISSREGILVTLSPSAETESFI